MLVGYARCSTDAQDLTVQRDALMALGVKPNRIYVDHGLTGANRARPGLREALAACRSGDTLVVTKLDRPGTPEAVMKCKVVAMLVNLDADEQACDPLTSAKSDVISQRVRLSGRVR